MKTLTVVTSVEYKMNIPSIFVIIDGQYFGCQIYPNSRNFPNVDYWGKANSSDSDRGFVLTEKEFSNEEILKIKKLQEVANTLALLIPKQPEFPYIPAVGFKIKRGKAYEEYKTKKEEQEKQIKEYFHSINIFEKAKFKAENDLRNILRKNNEQNA